jgi:hypothetical protein
VSVKKRTPVRQTLLAAGVGAAALLGCWSLGCGGPPQMGADEQVFAAVDALFTAVTARDEKLLGQCERRLHALRGAGQLPGGAADFLDGVIGKARDGRWGAAAEKLYGFMKGQRREGAAGHPPRKEKRGARPANSPGGK